MIRWNILLNIFTHSGEKSEGFPYPIIEDTDRRLAVLLGMLDSDEVDSHGIPLTARAVFVIDPKKKFRLSLLYPATTGRNFKYAEKCIKVFYWIKLTNNLYFSEILRTIDAMQLSDKYKVATPADWQVILHLPILLNLFVLNLHTFRIHRWVKNAWFSRTFPTRNWTIYFHAALQP